MATKHRLWATGARVLAVVAASTTALKLGGHQPDLRKEPSLNGGKEALLVEKWQGIPEHAFVPSPRISRHHSFAASTRSTCSIITYMKGRGIFNFFDERVSAYHVDEFAVADNYSQDRGDDIQDSSLGAPAIVPLADARGVSNSSPRDVSNGLSIHWDLAEGVSKSSTEKKAPNLDRLGNHSSLQFQAGLPSALHQQSVALFTAIAPYISTSPELGKAAQSLLGDLGRLYLWGHDFGNGRLEFLLSTSPELRSTILELMATISKILTAVICPMLLSSTSDSAIIDQAALVSEMLQRFYASESKESEQDEAYESDDTDSDSDYDVDDAALVIHSSVDCLMGLLPSIERSLLAMDSVGNT